MSTSIRNRLPGTIEKIVSDKVVSEVVINTAAGAVTSIITTGSVQISRGRPRPTAISISHFNVSFTEEQQRKGIEYNYRREPPSESRGEAPKLSRSAPDGPTEFAAASGTDVDTYTRERPGVSAFALEDGAVYHTYSAYSRGVDSLWGMYQWLDRAPKGRNEDGNLWWRRHDEYKSAPQNADSCCH